MEVTFIFPEYRDANSGSNLTSFDHTDTKAANNKIWKYDQ
jgi:hypothetical protein